MALSAPRSPSKSPSKSPHKSDVSPVRKRKPRKYPTKKLTPSQSLQKLKNQLSPVKGNGSGAPSLSELHHSRSAYLFSCRHNGLIAMKSMDTSYAGLSSLYSDLANNGATSPTKRFGVTTFPSAPRFKEVEAALSPGPVYNIRDASELDGRAWSFGGGKLNRSSFIGNSSTGGNVGPTSYSAAQAKDKTQQRQRNIVWSESRTKRWVQPKTFSPGPKYDLPPSDLAKGGVRWGPKPRAKKKQTPNTETPEKNTKKATSTNYQQTQKDNNAKNELTEEMIEKRRQREIRKTQISISNQKIALNYRPPPTWAGRLGNVSMSHRQAKRTLSSNAPGPKYNIGMDEWEDPYPRKSPYVPRQWR